MKYKYSCMQLRSLWRSISFLRCGNQKCGIELRHLTGNASEIGGMWETEALQLFKFPLPTLLRVCAG